MPQIDYIKYPEAKGIQEIISFKAKTTWLPGIVQMGLSKFLGICKDLWSLFNTS